MELWIRSQDKEALMKVNNGVLYHQTEDMRDCIVIKESPSYYHIIGAYKSKERALEVLDEIQNIKKIKFALQCDKESAFNGISEKDINYLLHQCAVFDMPQE